MSGFRVISFFLSLLFLVLVARHSVGQDASAEAVFESLGMTERVSQLLLVDARKTEIDTKDHPLAFGGIILNQPTPKAHLDKVLAIQQLFSPPAMVFATLSETMGLEMEGLPQLGSAAVYQRVHEPHLFYESGLAIADQCRLLGISALLASEKIFENKDVGLDWRLSEFNQGLHDGRMLSLHDIRIIEYANLSIDDLKDQQRPVMIMLTQNKVPEFHAMVQEAISNDMIDMEEIEGLSKKILSLKSEMNVERPNMQLDETKLRALNFNNLKFDLGRSSTRVLSNPGQLIPVRDIANKKIASVNFERNGMETFKKYLEKYAPVGHFDAQYDMSQEAFSELWNKLTNYDLVICALHNSNEKDLSKMINYQLFQGWLNISEKCITASFLAHDRLVPIHKILREGSLISTPEDNDIYHALVPQVIFGGLSLEGRLMRGAEPLDYDNRGLAIKRTGSFAYSYPEAVGLSSKVLGRIDSIAKFAIQEKAIPGCQVLVAKDDQVIFQKSYGFHTYDSLREVRDDDLYDLASITKVSGALPGLMKLYEEGKFDLDANLGTYLKYFRRGKLKEVTFREILAHQAGLMPWIPYWQTTIKKNGKFKRRTLSAIQSKRYPYELADGLFLHPIYKKKIYKQIRKTEIGEKKYLYSGLTFYIFPEIIEVLTGEKYEDYIYNKFYKPLGATTLTYNPDEKFDVDKIVPTEFDSLFRKSQIHGKVHDEGAAMMQGVSSNAGLFSNANDLAKLFQMYCNYGEYGGQRYFQEATVREFTRCQFPENDNRRALGFDRPMPVPHENGNTAISVSQLSFGHTGFTGTFAWADPEYDLVYIFLSNRVYQTRANTKLYDLNIRTNIQQVIYDAMQEF